MLIKLSGHEVAYAYGYLANAYGLSTNEPITRTLDPDGKVCLIDALAHVESACQPEHLQLPATLAHIPRVRSAVESAETYADVQNPLHELRTRMHDELKSRLFLYVPMEEAKYYGRTQAFGPKVDRRFPDLEADIGEAGDCIAIGKPTAAVFHLMRVMESLVQQFGAQLGVPAVSDLNWQKILDQINKHIKALPESNKNEKENKAKLSAASAHLFNVKLAWRNPTMHPKSTYTAEEASGIYDCVKRFAEHLADTI